MASRHNRFDALLYFDETGAVEPLPRGEAAKDEVPLTYLFGV